MVEQARKTTVGHVRDGLPGIYIGRAFGAWAKPGPGNEKPGRYGNPFKPGGVPNPEVMLRTYFASWWNAPGVDTVAVRREALERMKPGQDPIGSFEWYLRLRVQNDPSYRRDVRELLGQHLRCFCKAEGPETPCHGDVLANFVEGRMAPSERLPLIIRLTLIRPWGWAVFHAGKDVENRGPRFPTLQVGSWLAIHNGLKWDEGGADFIQERLEDGNLPLVVPEPEEEPSGCIIGLAQVEATTRGTPHRPSPWFMGETGLWLGERRLIEPITYRGGQGVQRLPADVAARAWASFQRARAGGTPPAHDNARG